MKTGSPLAATLPAPHAQSRERAARHPAYWLRRLISGGHVLALADQAVVSGTSFLTLILIARSTGPAELGAFAIGNSILAGAAAIQHSLVSLPYSVQRHDAESPAERAFGSLVLSALLSAMGLLLMALAALALSALNTGHEVASMAWALAALMPFVLTREFVREFCFAHLEWLRALILDVAVASIQLAALGWLALTGRMSVSTAFAALGAASGVAALFQLYRMRADFAVRAGRLRATTRQSWALGKWLLVSRAAVLVQGYAAHWLSLLVAGAAVTGLYTACVSVVSFANPVLFGLWNVLTPGSVLAWKRGGAAGLWRRTLKDLFLLGGLAGALCIPVLLAGNDIMRLLYPRPDYGGLGDVVSVLALATLVWALSIPASNALASMECTRPMAAVAGFSALLNVLLVWSLMTSWGLLGAACAILAANGAGTIGRWTIFLTRLRRSRP